MVLLRSIQPGDGGVRFPLARGAPATATAEHLMARSHGTVVRTRLSSRHARRTRGRDDRALPARGEMAMRYWNWPPAVYSGWRATAAGGPVNPFGWRGQPVARPRLSDFVVVLTGGAEVECLRCPADETLI